MYLSGRTQADIGRELGVDQSTVSNDLKAVRQTWEERALADYDRWLSEELAKIDRIEAEANAAWERSQKPAETTVTEKSDGKNGGVKASVKREGRDGSADWLRIAMSCVEKRVELVGMIRAVGRLKQLEEANQA